MTGEPPASADDRLADVADVRPDRRSGLLKALAHPLRAQILGVLQERAASPKELAEEFGIPLGNISYHVRVLAHLKLIHVVKRTPRRGAVEHHYEAVPVVDVSEELWGEAPTLIKHAIADAALREIERSVSAAAAGDGFDRADAHLTRSRLVLDEPGWKELAGVVAETLQHAQHIQHESQQRLEEADHEGEMRACLVMMLFEHLAALEGPTGDPGAGAHEPCRSKGGAKAADRLA